MGSPAPIKSKPPPRPSYFYGNTSSYALQSVAAPGLPQVIPKPLSRAWLAKGTRSSNLFPSSGESQRGRIAATAREAAYMINSLS